MPVDDEIRGLKRELASSRAQKDQEARASILASLHARGVAVDQPVEKRSPGRPKKSEK